MDLDDEKLLRFCPPLAERCTGRFLRYLNWFGLGVSVGCPRFANLMGSHFAVFVADSDRLASLLSNWWRLWGRVTKEPIEFQNRHRIRPHKVVEHE